jgi:hypothetical protein
VRVEDAIAEAIAANAHGLRSGARLLLDQVVPDVGGHPIPGPHLVGRVDFDGDYRPAVRLTRSTRAGRTARVLVEEGLLDLVIDRERNVVKLVG